MFVQISPNENDLSETLCSLNFASRVKGVELGPAKKQLDNSEFLRYKQLVMLFLLNRGFCHTISLWIEASSSLAI